MIGGDLAVPAVHAVHAPTTLLGSCGSVPGLACRLVWDLSHDARAAQLTDNFLAGPVHLLLRVAFVVILALVIQALARKVINRITERAAESILPQFRNGVANARLVPGRMLPRRLRDRSAAGTGAEAEAEAEAAEAATGAAPSLETLSSLEADAVAEAESSAAAPAASSYAEHALISERRHQRVRALGSILRSAASVIIFSIAGIVVLGDLGINLAPLLASASVVGLAIGFGAQSMVRDYLAGIFMMVEDQYGVGDMVTIGDATGTVESVTLRITSLRDLNGIVWHIRNGSVEQVGNESQGWARAVIDFPVPYEADLGTIRSLLSGATQALWDDPAWRAVMLEPPEVWGAQEVSSTGVTMRIVVKTAPLRQWGVEREMRARMKAALDAAGIRPPAVADAKPPPRRTHPPGSG